MLTQRQFLISIVLGVIFWLTGALCVRFGAEAIFVPGSITLILAYIVAFPMLYVALVISRPILGLPMHEMFVPVVVMTTAALFLDGSVIGFYTVLYGDVPLTVMHGAAWIMWGGAAGMLIAGVLSRGNWRILRK